MAMAYSFGDVVLVPFPFTNQIHLPLGMGDALVTEWQSAGLVKPSLFKPVFATIEQSLILRVMGTLTETDESTLHNILAQVLG